MITLHDRPQILPAWALAIHRVIELGLIGRVLLKPYRAPRRGCVTVDALAAD